MKRAPRQVAIAAFAAAASLAVGIGTLLFTRGLHVTAGRRADPGSLRPRLQITITSGDTKVFALVAACLGVALLMIAVWLVLRDLGERESSQRALHHAQLKYEHIVENAPVGIFQSTPQGQLLSANPALARMYGYATPGEMIRERTDLARQSFVDADERDAYRRALSDKGELLNYEHETYRKDGTIIWVSEDVRCVRDQQGAALMFEGIVTDITDRVQSEQALRDSEQKYRLLFQSNPQPMWVFDPNTLRFLDVNEAAVRNYGYNRREFLNMALEDIRPPEDIPALRDAMAGELVRRGVYRHKKHDGTILHVEISEDEIEYLGKPARLVVAVDVTDRLKAQEQLLQMSKIEAVGQLAGGIAHDFNNLVMVMQSYCELLNTTVMDERSRKYALQIKTAAQRAAGITQQLLAFSRKQVLAPRVISINEVLTQSLGMLRPLIGEHIQFIYKPGASLWHINADPVQIEQVIMNLAVNARDAMPRGGKLTIETTNVQLDEQYCSAHYPVEPGRYVQLSVADTGTGMDPETQKRIFEPFFTTKGVGKGTGLGLATVYGIVKQSGGYIWVYSEPAHGTVFKLYFPHVALRRDEVRQAQPEIERLPQGSGTILLVEDEQSLGQVEAEFLQVLGYEVLLAATSTEALHFVDTRRIDLVVTDVVLPGVSGKAVVEQLRKTRPDVKVIFMSGYTEDTTLIRDIAAGEPFLQKPFTLTALGKMVLRTLTT